MNRKILPDDIISSREYSKKRKEKRLEISQIKKYRRINIGPYITLYFENFHTMVYQIQEMLLVEKGDKDQMLEEIESYNSLVPLGNELIATLMIEIDNPVKRNLELRKITGIENNVKIIIENEVVEANPCDEENRTKEDGKTSSVHFIKFSFDDKCTNDFLDVSNKVSLFIDHPKYSHATDLLGDYRKALGDDLT